MAYQSEIELRIRVVDKELRELERRVEKIQRTNPFSASGARKDISQAELKAQQSSLNVEKNRLKLQQDSVNLRAKELNLVTSWRKALADGAQIQRDIASSTAKASRDRAKSVAGSAVIGGAFPLLFGQGVGASLGGGLGGAAGGALGGQFGFGLSLVGTAIGQAIDTLSTELNKLAKSLKAPSEALASLEEAGIKVADSSRQQIKQLEEAGRVYDAQTVLFAEITARLGTNAVNQLNALNDASEDLQDEFSALKGQILSDLLPAVVLATRAFADIVAILNNIQIPQSLLDLAVGTVAGTLLPGGLPPGLLGTGVKQVTGALAPGTAPDRSDALDKQNRLNRATQNRIDLLEQERQLLKLSDDLLDDAVYKARKRAINTAWRKQEQNLVLEGKNTEEKITELLLERDRQLKKLADDRNRAQERMNKQRDREAEIAAREAQRAAEAAAREAKRAFEAGEKLQTQQERKIKMLMLESDLEKELLRIENARVDAIKQTADIAPEQQPKATAQANTLAQMEAGFVIGEALAKGVLDEGKLRQAREDALRPLEQERALLEARIKGTEDEEKLRQRINDIIRQTPSLDRERVEELVRGNQELEKQAEKTEKLRQIYTDLKENVVQRLGVALEDALVSTIEAAVTGAKDLGETLQSIASTLLKDLGRMFLRAGIQGIGAGIGLPGFADGGTVMPGGTYLVGERGPEILQLNPNGSGQVINNNQLSSAMNRYRRSGTTSTNESAATMQGGEGGTAVLDKPIDVRYTVERINNVDYVTAAQFQAGMQQAAQQGAQRGEQQTLKRLQMSSSTRRRIGL